MARSFNSLPTWLLKTRLGKELQAEAAAEIETDRAAMAAEIERLQTEAAETLPALNEAAAAAKAEFEAGAKIQAKLRAEFGDAERRAQGARLSLDHQISNLQAQLRISADPSIDVLIAALQDLWETARHVRPDVTEYGEKDARGLRPRTTNMPSIVGRMDAIREAILEAEALKLRTGVDVAARLDQIRDGVPGLQDAEEFIPVIEPPPPPDPDAEAKVIERSLHERYHPEGR